MTTQPDPIEALGLTKRHDTAYAVRGLDLSIPEGCVFGLIGRNGAGKTTTLNMLLGLLAPTVGEARIFGENARSMSKACRQRIGYLSEEPFPYDLLFIDILRFLSGFFDEWDWAWCDGLMRRLGVAGNKRLDEMSLGQRRIAELVIAVAHKPDLLILDDPAVGLDAAARKDMIWTVLELAKEERRTIVFSSHILQDVERVVDRVGIIEEGELRVTGSLDEIKERTRRIIMPVAEAPASIEGEILRETRGRDVVIVTESFREEMTHLLGHAEIERMNLEEIFVAMCQQAGEGV